MKVGLVWAVGAALIASGGSTAAWAAQRNERPPLLPARLTSGAPTSIYDGDTFRFGSIRIRLWGIDAPEMKTRFGRAARQKLVWLIAGRSVRCRDTGTRSGERIVGRCWNASGKDLSAEMVRSGYAVDWPHFSDGRYRMLQTEALAKRSGLYAYGIEPWR